MRKSVLLQPFQKMKFARTVFAPVRPEWCTVAEPVSQEHDWEESQLFVEEDNVDRTDVGWELEMLSPENVADSREGKVVREDLVYRDHGVYDAFVLHNVLTQAECDEVIAAANKKNYTPALINIGRGRQRYLPGYRSGLRCIVDSPLFAQLLLNRVGPHLPKGPHPLTGIGGFLQGINERMRILCYHHPDNRFEEHCDGCFTHPVTKASSRYTLQIYLNDIPDAAVDGGGTAFTRDGKVVTPRAGSVLCFTQNLMHEGQPLRTGGIKYTIRTEAMYGRSASHL